MESILLILFMLFLGLVLVYILIKMTSDPYVDLEKYDIKQETTFPYEYYFELKNK